MEQNSKNQLQELVMKDNNNSPKYINTEINSKPITFKSTVEFYYRNKLYRGMSYVFNSKKLAQFDAAKNGLSQILNLDDSKYYFNIDNKKDIYVLVDYENYQDDKEIDLFKKQQPSINLIKYVNTKHPKAITADKLVPSYRRDATDILMVCETALIKKDKPNSFIFIVTRDKFASVLEDIYDKVYNTTSIEKTFEKIKSL